MYLLMMRRQLCKPFLGGLSLLYSSGNSDAGPLGRTSNSSSRHLADTSSGLFGGFLGGGVVVVFAWWGVTVSERERDSERERERERRKSREEGTV